MFPRVFRDPHNFTSIGSPKNVTEQLPIAIISRRGSNVAVQVPRPHVSSGIEWG